jgi:hypothetical protein
MANLLANFDQYESQLIKLEVIAFDAGTFGTGNAGNINIHQNSSQMICRNHYSTITDFVTDPNALYEVTGFAIPYNTDRQLAPRDLNDITELVTHVVTLNSVPTGIGTLTGGGTYIHNHSATINATPPDAYNFINWTENGTQVTTNNSYTFNVTEDRTLIANFQIKTFTITATTDANGTISPLGTTTVNYGASQSYTITPNTGYEINQVLVDGVNNSTAVSSGTYTFTNVTANHTISVTFKAKQFTLTLNPAPSTLPTTVTNPIQVTFDAAVSGIVAPNAMTGYTFQGWEIEGTPIANGNIWTYPSNKTAVARWLYTISYTNNNPNLGSVTPSGTPINYTFGDNATYSFIPEPGCHVSSLIVDGVQQLTNINNEVTQTVTYSFINISASHTIVVNFARNCYALNPANVIGSGATLSMNPSGCVQHGNQVTFHIGVSSCYNLTDVIIDGVSMGAIESYGPLTVNQPLPLIQIVTQIKTYTITATPLSDPHGSISPSGTSTTNCGDNRSYAIHIASGYRVHLFVDGNAVTVPPAQDFEYTFTNVNANHTIHAEFEEWPQVVIQFGPGETQGMGGYVYPNFYPTAQNYVLVDSGTVSYPFTIVANQGYEIDKVLVDDANVPASVLSGSYEFVDLRKNHTIFATFKPIMFTITATTDGNGTLTPGGTVQVPYGSAQTFSAIPNEGFNLTAIKVDGHIDPPATATGIYTFENITDNHTISAEFTKKQYTITTIWGANGTVFPVNPTVEHGDNKKITFYPAQGYKVAEVLIDDVPHPASAEAGFFTFTNVMSNHTIEVTFTKLVFTITATHTGGGHIQPSGIEYVEYDENSSIYVFESEEGYHVKYALIDGENNPAAIAAGFYRFLGVRANHTIHIVFVPDNHLIAATATSGGAISPEGAVLVPDGNTQTFIMNPFAGYKLVRVIVDGFNNEEAVEQGFYTFFDVSEGHTIMAQFEPNLYNVYLPEDPGAIITPVNGSTSPTAHGSKFMFVVEPTTGYSPVYTVRVNNVVLYPIDGVYTINNIVTDQYITVTDLVLLKYQIVSKTNAGGMISPLGITMIEHGGSQTFEITANDKYKIDRVEVDGVNVGAVESYTFSNVTEAGKIEAFFKYSPVGIGDNETPTIEVFSYHNVVTILNNDLVPVKSVEIIDMYGRMIWQGKTTAEKTEITLNVATGIYGVRIATETNVTTTKVNITK